MITLDTSGIIAYLFNREPHHQRVRDALNRTPGPWFIPAAILSEVAYHLESHRQYRALRLLLEDIQSGSYQLDCGDENVSRILDLIDRYADLPLGLSDAAVIACAERNGGLVLSLDRDFWIVSREHNIRILPE